jgi:GNAT superfamily N-acetyltransferase
MSEQPTLDGLAFHAVDSTNWGDFADLFEGRGGPKTCWCMVCRTSPPEAAGRDGASRKAAMKSIVDRGIPVGVLCYHQGKAIAWCSIAPRDTYRPLGGSESESPLEQIWSLVCFFIKRDYRNQGVTRKLIRSVSRFDGSVSGVGEVVAAFARLDGGDEAADVSPGILHGALLCGPHPMLEVGRPAVLSPATLRLIGTYTVS